MQNDYTDISIKIPEYVRRALERLVKNGYEAYAVGGGVRDSIIGRRIHDWDVTTAAPVDATEKIFQRNVPTGKKFGTVMVVTGGHHIEITTFRTEGTYSESRHPENVDFVSDLLTDLARRDFTMNAMAADIDGRVIDPYDGISDIRAKLIRCVGDPRVRFTEDALRMLRAVGFAARLGFLIEKDTLSAIYDCAHLAAALSAERVRDETEKIIFSDRPELICLALEAGLLEKYCGVVKGTEEVRQRFARMKTLTKYRLTRWCALCALLMDVGAITEPKVFLSALRLDGKTVEMAEKACRIMSRGMPETRLGLKLLCVAEGVDVAFCAAAVSDMMTGGRIARALLEITTSRECLSVQELAVSGIDLMEAGVVEGREVGKKLHELLDHVLEHPEDNTKEKLLKMVKQGSKL